MVASTRMLSYPEFLDRKSQIGQNDGFEPLWIPDSMFDFQKYGTDKFIRKGRAAVLEDCGLGKTYQMLVYAQNVVMHTNGRVLVVAPLGILNQTKREGDKFGIECQVSRDGRPAGKITITNFEQLEKFDPTDFEAVVIDEAAILKSVTGKTRSFQDFSCSGVSLRPVFSAAIRASSKSALSSADMWRHSR